MLIIVVVLYNPLFAKPMITKDKAIANITAVNFRNLFYITDELSFELLEDNCDEIDRLEFLYQASDRLFSLELSFESVKSLDDNFDISLLPLIEYCDSLIAKLENENELSSTDLEKLGMIADFSEKFSRLRLGSYYQVDSNPFTKLDIPNEVTEFLNDLEWIIED